MRHRKKINHLSRTSAHRKAMLSNMATSLILHKRITTTTAKAKALRSYVEPLITRSKEDTTHSRRMVFSYLQSKEAVNELFREVSTKVAERPGGYTRIIKMGNRLGDNADMCLIELVDYNEHLMGEAEAPEKKTGGRRRRRRGSGSSKTEAAAPATPKAKAEKPAKEATAEAEKPEEPKAAQEPVAEVKKETEDAPKAEEPKAEKPEAKAEETKAEAAPETEAKKTEEEKPSEEKSEDKDKPEKNAG